VTPIRVLIVDDSAVIRRLLTAVIDTDPEIDVVGVAHDGQMGLDRIDELQPDLVTLDVEMPIMDGIATLRHIRKRYPRLPVVMFSTLTERGASATIEALSLGASDYVTKPSNVGSIGVAIERVKEQLIPKIKALCPRRSTVPRAAPVVGAPRPRAATTGFDVVAIGSSTGGPSALREVLAALPSSFPLPIVITQHMPPLFTKQLADRLHDGCAISVREAVTGDLLAPGLALIAPGDRHLVFARKANGVTAKLSDAPAENFCRPSVDTMLRSVHATFGGRVLTVMLTGMGADGCKETGLLRDAGGYVIAQDEESSVVWGMPGAVVHAGFSDVVVPLEGVARAIVDRVATAGSRPTRPRPAVSV